MWVMMLHTWYSTRCVRFQASSNLVLNQYINLRYMGIKWYIDENGSGSLAQC
jgi:hypothetical protein